MANIKRTAAALLSLTTTSALAQTPSLINSTCENPLRVNFWGDFFVDEARASAVSLDTAAPILSWGHFNVANFEGSIGDNKKAKRAFPDFPYALMMPPQSAKILRDAKIFHVTRANNHSMDFGAAGMQHTSRVLEQNGIHFAGVGENSFEAIKPLSLIHSPFAPKVAVLSFATTWPKESWATNKQPGIAYPTLERLQAAIENAKREHDFVVISVHWGAELSTELRPYQHGLVDAAIKAGADLIYGHHAHMAQGIETRKNVPIAWGLGNFLFAAIGKQTNMSLGMSTEFCIQKNENEAKKTIKTVFIPLETGSKAAQATFSPLTHDTFLRFAAQYKKKGLIAPQTSFFIPDEEKTLSFEEWLKPGFVSRKKLPAMPQPAQKREGVTPPPPS